MSLYHETAEILALHASAGSLRSRVYGRKDAKWTSPPAQIYALAAETCKWSDILSEVIDKSGLLREEKKVSNDGVSWLPILPMTCQGGTDNAWRTLVVSSTQVWS